MPIVDGQVLAAADLSGISRPGASLVKTVTQTYSASTWFQVTFDAVGDQDLAGMADVASSKLVVPATGTYLVGAHVAHQRNYTAAAIRAAAIIKGTSAPSNSTPYNRLVQESHYHADEWYAALSQRVQLNAGDAITLWFWGGSGTTADRTFGPNIERYNFNLWMQRA